MKTILYYCVLYGCCLYCHTTKAQYTFNKLFQTDTTSMLSVAVIPVEDGYLVSGGMNSLNNYSAIYLRKLDLLGQEKETIILEDSYPYQSHLFGNSLCNVNDSLLVLTATIGNSSEDRNIVLMSLNKKGQKQWQKIYPTPDTLEGNVQVLPLQDGFLITGWAAKYDSINNEWLHSSAYILKTDREGNYLWSKTYAYWSMFLYSCTTQDGGYLLSGYCHQAATGFDMYAVKTDSLGTVEWEQTYGTPSHDGGCKVVQLPNGNMMLLGWKAGTSTQIYHIAAIDPQTGYQLWQRNYVFNDITGNDGSPLIDDDGNIITIIYNFGGGDSKQNKLTKIDASNGDILWQQIINSGLNPDDDYLRDIEPTPDGGYVLAGFNYNFPQSSWVVKVDSLGNTCGVADCDNYVEPIGVAAVEMERMFSVYPNPSNGQVQIQTQWHEPLQLSIIDVLGRTVYAQTIQPYNNAIVNTLSEGLYVCKLHNSQQQLIATQKLIVIE